MIIARRVRIIMGILLLAVSLCLLVYSFLPFEHRVETRPLDPVEIPWVLPALG